MSKSNERGFSALRAELKREREKVKALNAELSVMHSDDIVWELVKDNQAIKNRIIEEYLKTLSGRQKIELLGPSGFTALTPVNRPKNLADAKRLAEKIIRY